jgi:hypothetical protein
MAYATAAAYKDAKFVQFWLDQLDGYHQEYKPWEKRCERIVKRYRDERQERSDGAPDVNSKFNALWSNVQTLSPAVYKKAPQPVIERRYLDKDPIARFASMTLERSLEVTIEECYFHPSVQKAVLDYLLVGRGVVWNRYEPTYGTPEDIGPTATDDEGQGTPAADRAVQEDDGEEGEPTEPVRPVTWEKVYQDYVGWKNFRHTPAPVWEEVWWVAKRSFMTRRELRTRWPDAKDSVSGKLLADLVPLQDQSFKDVYDGNKEKLKKSAKTAEVWEIWDKTNKEVVFIATEYPNAPLERTSDPLGLQEFWPCGKPLYATVTNDTLVPVPDYVEYQDQAEELDNLTARIKALTDAVRVNGVYDASFPELKRILQEGADNRLIAVAKWSELSQKGGLEGSISFIPLKDIVEALIRLYEARDKVKADMAEITGLSDIVRGQAQGAAKTATEQRIKGQFATLRLQDRQSEVARFCRDTLAIAAEVISEQFSPEILAEMTGMKAFIAEELKNEPSMQAPPSPQMGHNGGPPMDGQPGAQPPPDHQMMAQQQQAAQQAQEQRIAQLTDQIFQQAIDLLKNDKMRTFRIDIETDSTVEIDKQAEKEAVVEMLTAMGGFLEKSMQIGMGVPEMVPALGQSLLFAFRRFGVGRDVEGAWEQAIDKLSQKAKNPGPKPPSPEEIKAQAEMQKQQMEGQRMAAQAQIEQQKGQMEMQMAQAKHQMDLEKMQAELAIKKEELNLKREELAMRAQEMQIDAVIQERQAQVDLETTERKAQIDADNMDRQMQAGERKHELGLEVMEAKAKQAKKPKVKESA